MEHIPRAQLHAARQLLICFVYEHFAGALLLYNDFAAIVCILFIGYLGYF